jgi:hypothetical protein
MVQTGAHALVRQDARKVHAHCLLAGGHLDQAAAFLVERRTVGLEQLAGTRES